MATRKAKKKTSTRKRIRRTDEQLIADLQEKIQEVKARARARELKESGAVKSSLSAIRAIDKALEAAAEEEDGHLRHALADARKPLADHLLELGIRLPKARLPRGRRPRRS